MRLLLIIVLLFIYRQSFSNECRIFFDTNTTNKMHSIRSLKFVEATFQSIKQAQNENELVSILSSRAMQLQIRLLESMGQLLLGTLPESSHQNISIFYTRISELNMAIKKYNFTVNTSVLANNSRNLPKDVKAYLELKTFRAREEFKAFLKESDWSNGTTISILQGILFQSKNHIKEQSEESVIKYLDSKVNYLLSQTLPSLQAKLNKPRESADSLKTATEEVINDLEALILTTFAANDIFKYERVKPLKLSEADRALFLKYRSNKYTQFHLSNPGKIEIPTVEFYRLIRIVSELKKLTERNEVIESIADTMLFLKKEDYTEFAKAYTENLLFPTSADRVNFNNEAINLVNELLQNKTLEKFSEGIKPEPLYFTRESQLSLSL